MDGIFCVVFFGFSYSDGVIVIISFFLFRDGTLKGDSSRLGEQREQSCLDEKEPVPTSGMARDPGLQGYLASLDDISQHSSQRRRHMSALRLPPISEPSYGWGGGWHLPKTSERRSRGCRPEVS